MNRHLETIFRVNRILEIFLKGCECFIIITKCIVGQDVMKGRKNWIFGNQPDLEVVSFQVRQSVLLKMCGDNTEAFGDSKAQVLPSIVGTEISCRKESLMWNLREGCQGMGATSAEAGAFFNLDGGLQFCGGAWR